MPKRKHIKPVKRAPTQNAAPSDSKKQRSGQAKWWKLAVLCIGVATVMTTGVVHGLWTDRWPIVTASLAESVGRMEQVPMVIGDWDGQDVDMDPEQIKKAEVAGYVSRKYVNRQTGDVVSFLMLGGRPGPVSVHTPDICYRGAGYRFATDPTKHNITVGDEPMEFLAAIPERDQAGISEFIHILWSWSMDGRWSTPKNPRVTFARNQCLFKLYVFRDMLTREVAMDGDACTQFAQALVPEINKALFAHASSN